MAIDPKSLTAEEKALIDIYASRIYANSEANMYASEAYADGLRLIEARRDLFGETQAEPKRETCPNCKTPVVHRNKHVTAVGDNRALNTYRFTCMPTQEASELAFLGEQIAARDRAKAQPVARDLPHFVLIALKQFCGEYDGPVTKSWREDVRRWLASAKGAVE